MAIAKLVLAEKFVTPAGGCSPLLLLEKNPPDLIRILRLLSGAAIVWDAATEDCRYLGKTNFINRDHDVEALGLDTILEYLFDERPEEAELTAIFSRLASRNRGFYAEILEELPFLLQSLDDENFAECFLYLYRLMERISVACPLIFASRENDFRGAHAFLASMFDSKSAPGELGTLKKFLHRYSEKNNTFNLATLDFDVSGYDEEFSTELFSQLRSNVVNELNSVAIDDERRTFSVPYKDVSSFVVSVRNRAFHNHSDRQNFRLGRLGGAQALFGALVPSLLVWFAYVFVDFARWQIAGTS
jgi:hypothetical protein